MNKRQRLIRTFGGAAFSALAIGAPAPATAQALPNIIVTTPLPRNPSTGLPMIFNNHFTAGRQIINGQTVDVVCRDVNLIVQPPHRNDRPQPPYGTFPTEESYAGNIAFIGNRPIGNCRRP